MAERSHNLGDLDATRHLFRETRAEPETGPLLPIGRPPKTPRPDRVVCLAGIGIRHRTVMTGFSRVSKSETATRETWYGKDCTDGAVT